MLNRCTKTKKHQKHLLTPFQKGLKAKGDLFLFSVASRDKGYISPFTKLKIKNLVDFFVRIKLCFFFGNLFVGRIKRIFLVNLFKMLPKYHLSIFNRKK